MTDVSPYSQIQKTTVACGYASLYLPVSIMHIQWFMKIIVNVNVNNDDFNNIHTKLPVRLKKEYQKENTITH